MAAQQVVPSQEEEKKWLWRRIYGWCLCVCLLVSNALGQQAGQIVASSTTAVAEFANYDQATEVALITQSTVTGEDGRFVFPTLRPTHYEFSVESSGSGRSGALGSSCWPTRT